MSKTPLPLPLLRVRAHTQAIHQALEELPLSRAIVDERLTRAGYARLLTELLPLHRALERGLAAYPQLADLRAEAERSALIERDLERWGAGEVSASGRAAGERYARLTETLIGALGAAYVVVGSRMGSRVLVRHLAPSLGVELEAGQGLDYHLEGAEGFPVRWRAICLGLDGLVPSSQLEAFAEAGRLGMEAYYQLYAALGAELGL